MVGSQQIALITDSCVAIIRQVPNQKLYFKNDERRGESGREEDDIIAWTWKHFFMYPNQPDWLVRLPMTKTVRLGVLLTICCSSPKVPLYMCLAYKLNYIVYKVILKLLLYYSYDI